jgi:hypothetical protein
MASGSTIYQTVEGSVPYINYGQKAQGEVGEAFSYQIQAYSNNSGGTSYYATEVPEGLSLNETTGVISGTPSKAGTYQVIIYAGNENGYGNYGTVVLTLANTFETE